MRRLTLVTVLGALCALAVPAAASDTDWLNLRTMNMTHQGGEDEAPSNTMYALARSMRLGADMLEVDIHVTEDGKVVVLHDSSVERTTNGSGSVYDMSLRELQKLDSAHNFVPGVGTSTDYEPDDYVFRGVRTGERKPPRGFRPRDFRIPTLVEVMRKYPTVPINIEIKGRSDGDAQSFTDNAEALAGTLDQLDRTDGIIVASFNDAAIVRFQQLAPEIDLAPSIAETAAFKFGGVPPGPGKVAFQVPITFSGQQVVDDEFVESSHENGLAVHVWLSNDPENDATYRQLLDWNVDAVMPAAPAAFERVLCASDVPRPKRPPSFPGKHCNHKSVSIACDVAPTGVSQVSADGIVAVRLRRSDDFAGGCAGRVRLRVAGEAEKTRFDFGRFKPSEGGPTKQTVELDLSRRVLRRLAESPHQAKVSTRAFQAYGSTARYRLAR